MVPLFILAHELGHIALGHIEEDGVLIDESMDHNVQDQEEADANAFAIELLTGDKDLGTSETSRALAQTPTNLPTWRGMQAGNYVSILATLF